MQRESPHPVSEKQFSFHYTAIAAAALRIASPLAGEIQKGTVFRLFAFVLLLVTQCPLLYSQKAYWNNKGAKIYISGKGVISGMNTAIINDSNTVIVNYGKIKVMEMENKGKIELKGTAASIIIDSTLILEKGKIFLNANKIMLNNPDTAALLRTNGYLIAEDSLWGKLVWKIGEAPAGWKYVVPFVNDSLEDVGMEFQVVEPGTGEGSIEFSTFGTVATDSPNNAVQPPDMIYFHEAAATIGSNWQKIADRYWLTKPVDYTVPPLANVTLRYDSSSIAGTNTIEKNHLAISKLKDRCWEEVEAEIDTTERRFAADSLNDYYLWILHDSIEPQACYSGLTCGDAIWINDTLNPNPFLMTDTVMWFRFVATDTIIDVGIIPNNFNLTAWGWKLYDSDCTPGNLIDEYFDSGFTSQEGYLHVYENVTVNDTLILKIINTEGLTVEIKISSISEKRGMSGNFNSCGDFNLLDATLANFEDFPPGGFATGLNNFFIRGGVNSPDIVTANHTNPKVATAGIPFYPIWMCKSGTPGSKWPGSYEPSINNNYQYVHLAAGGDSYAEGLTFHLGEPLKYDCDYEICFVAYLGCPNIQLDFLFSEEPPCPPPTILIPNVVNFPGVNSITTRNCGQYTYTPIVTRTFTVPNIADWTKICATFNLNNLGITPGHTLDEVVIAPRFQLDPQGDANSIFLDDIKIKKVKCESCETGNVTTVSSSETWDVDVWSEGDIIIEPGAVLTITCTVAMPDNARIIVERGAKLIVDGGTITNVCGEMWEGIFVHGNAERTNNQLNEPHPQLNEVYDFVNNTNGSYPSDNDQHGVVVLNNATIENAYHAIRCGTDAPVSYFVPEYAGGIVVAENSIFRNNRYCVEIPRFNYRASDGPALYYFKECRFETDGALNGNTLPKNFITLWNVKGVTLLNNLFINRTPDIYHPAERGIGIMCYDAAFNVDARGLCTEQHVNGGCVNWDPDEDLGFHNLSAGVSISSSYLGGSNPAIRYTNFENNLFGILAQGTLYYKIYRNRFVLGNEPVSQWFLSFHPTGVFNIGCMFRLDENTFILPDDAPARAVYTYQSQNWPANIYKNRVEGGGDDRSYAFAFSFENSNLVNYCNTVVDPMDHFLVFQNGSIFERQGDCRQGASRPAGNVFDPSCSSTSNLHFYVGSNVPYFEYCNHAGSGFSISCTQLNSNPNPDFPTIQTTPGCATQIVEIPGSDGSDGFYGMRQKQEDLAALINDQYALLDGGRTDEILPLVHNEQYSANQLYDTLKKYSPFLSDDVLVALIFRKEFNGNKRSHLLIENAPHSNLIWKALKEADPPMNADSLDKLKEYQDSSSARKPIIDSLNRYKLQKGLNYVDMLYYASIDTNYSVEEIKDSLINEKDAPMRLLLGDLYLAENEYAESESVFDNLKVYFREDKELLGLRELQISLFEDTLTYYDLSEGELEDLEEIAFNDTSTAAIHAKLILEFVNDSIYPYPFEDKEEGSPKRVNEEEKPHEEKQDEELNESNLYKLIPTLIEGEMVGYVDTVWEKKVQVNCGYITLMDNWHSIIYFIKEKISYRLITLIKPGYSSIQWKFKAMLNTVIRLLKSNEVPKIYHYCCSVFRFGQNTWTNLSKGTSRGCSI